VVTTEDHTTLGTESPAVGILGLAKTLEAQDKLYFVGSAHVDTIDTGYTAGEDPSSSDDIIGWLIAGNFGRTVGFWHQDADTAFNELTYAGYGLPFDAGSTIWVNNKLPMSNGRNPDGNALDTTQQNNLNNRNANWTAFKGGVTYSRVGKVAAGEWIDTIRGRDNLKSDLEADIFDLLTNQQGKKIPYTDAGINIVAGVVETRLNDYKVNRGFLADPITISVPKAKDISRAEKVTRILNDMTFSANLAGAIVMVDLQGSLNV